MPLLLVIPLRLTSTAPTRGPPTAALMQLTASHTLRSCDQGPNPVPQPWSPRFLLPQGADPWVAVRRTMP